MARAKGMQKEIGDRAVWIVPLFLLLAIVVGEWRVVTGKEWLCYRDLGTTHLPAWAMALRIGTPAENPAASFGQPFDGNPNLLLHYPTCHSPDAMGLHFFLHWVLLWIGCWLLIRALGCGTWGAVLGSCAFALSGYVVSSISFLNGFTALAWFPWLLWSAVRLRDEPRPWKEAAIAVLSGCLLLRGGEPVIATLCVLLCAALLLGRPRRLAMFGGVLVAITMINLSFLRQVAAIARDSYRVVTGYSFDQAASASLHPARLLETLVPFLFGRPDRIHVGGWWGFVVSGNTFPYVYSLALGIVPLALALATLRWNGRRRFWIVAGALSLILSIGGYLPGARTAFELLPTHAVRYPIKAFLVTTLAISILASFGVDDLVRSSRENRAPLARRLVIAAGGLVLVAACLAWLDPDRIEHWLVRAWWDPRWRSAPDVILAPIVQSLPLRLGFAGACLLLVGHALGRPARRTVLLLLILVPIDLGWSALPLLPTVDAETYRHPSPFVRAAARLGRIYERAGKDLDAVRRGEFGSYASNEIRDLIVSGARQGWALTGAPHGMRYAFDSDSDGSYTWRNDLVGRRLEQQPWNVRLKWLRADGVRGVITYRIPIALGVTPIAQSEGWGVPNLLYRLEGSLPEVRRYARAISAGSAEEAVARFERPELDPSEIMVVEGAPALAADDREAAVTRQRFDVGEMRCHTRGSRPGYLFIARSYSPRVLALVDGRPVPVHPANVHLTAVPVPAGDHDVRVRF